MPKKPKVPQLVNPKRAFLTQQPKVGPGKVGRSAAARSMHGRSTGKK